MILARYCGPMSRKSELAQMMDRIYDAMNRGDL
ncbi:hypothetical protein BH10ACT11_BH10ACT11_09930 [soil metagenome]